MPIYTFLCENCGLQFSHIIKIKDRDMYVGKSCGNCNEGRIIRIPDAGNFVINGYNEKNGYSKGGK